MMKTWFLIFLFFFFSGAMIAQQIPNGDFEIWSGLNPDQWDTSNETVMGLYQFTTVTKETSNPQNGSNSAKVETVSQNIIFVGTVTMPGILTLGDFILDIVAETAVIEGGIAFAHRPLALKGYYQATPVANDSAFVGVGFTKWNPLLNQRDTIGEGLMYFSQTVNSWTEFTIPVQWSSPDNPDSCNIIVASSDVINITSFPTGSTIRVDNLSFEYSTVGIEVLREPSEIIVYPNPVSDILTFELNGTIDSETQCVIEIFNIDGKKVLSETNTGKQTINIPVNTLSAGVYSYVYSTATASFRGSIVVVK
jgi:hypothetical protein